MGIRVRCQGVFQRGFWRIGLLLWGKHPFCIGALFPSCEAIEEQGRLIGLALKVAASGGFSTVLQFLQFVSRAPRVARLQSLRPISAEVGAASRRG